MPTSLKWFSLLAFSAAVATAGAQDPVRTERISLRPAVAVKRSGAVKGYGSVRYELSAKAGQLLDVKLRPKSTFVYFNVLSTKTGYALDVQPAPREVTQWKGRLPSSGTYVVQVYLVRAAARRNSSAKFDLTMILR